MASKVVTGEVGNFGDLLVHDPPSKCLFNSDFRVSVVKGKEKAFNMAQSGFNPTNHVSCQGQMFADMNDDNSNDLELLQSG